MQDMLKFDGQLTLQCADEIRTKLINNLESHSIVTVDCSEATEVDLSFIQLLLAGYKTSLALGKEFRLASPPSGVLLTTLRQAGVLGDGMNASEHADDVFWMRGTR